MRKKVHNPAVPTNGKRWYKIFVAVLLLALLAWVFGSAIRDYLEPPLEPAVVPPPVTAPAIPPPDVPTSGLIDSHLFGEADEADAGQVERVLTVPETKLQLALKGIVSTDDSKLGYAIIQKSDKEEKHFQVGESVFGLATLDEIYVDRVILLRDGRYETLRLPVESMASDLTMERARKQEAKRIVSDFRQKLINRDGMALIKLFGFDTTFRNGGFAGFTIKTLGEEGARMLEVLGVEEGDLITAVNGKRFSESLEATQSLTELRHATEVDIEIDRKGIPMFFHFDFADLEQAAGNEEKTGGSSEPATERPATETDTPQTDGENI